MERRLPEGGEEMKISIIGYSGSGKSTLAAAFGHRYGLPVLHLDRVQFAPGWAERDRNQKLEDVEHFLDQNPEGWVMDGNYTNLWYDRRLRESDLIFFLDFGRWVCLRRVVSRFVRYHGQTRDSMGDGCVEKLDPEFIRWVLKDGRTKDKRQGYEAVLQAWPHKAHRIRNQRELNECYRQYDLPQT